MSRKQVRYTNRKTAVCMMYLSLLGMAVAVAAAPAADGSRMEVNYESLVSRADLSFDTPVTRSEEGMPIGNGRMGSLVWTTPSALHLQINRVDVFAMGNNTNSFPKGHNDYSSGCGYVDMHVVDYGDEVFTGRDFNQHLSVYEGLTTVVGKGVTSRVLAWNEGDVIAAEITDQRDTPQPIHFDLRKLRYAVDYVKGKNYELSRAHASQVQKGSHIAQSRLDIRDGRIVLVQEFTEGDFYSASAVAIGVTGRQSQAAYYNESTVRLSAAPGRGKVLALIASACSYDPKADVAALALQQLDRAGDKSFDQLLQDNRTWWGDFWAKSFVHLHSDDGVADYVEQNHTFFLYIMGSCSRGDYMPRFCGMLWGTGGDMREWGSQYWWNNQGTYFNGLTPANHPELLAPVFATYSRYYDSYALAARQQWGSQGIWIPETTWFDGLEVLPDDIAREVRDLYLYKKPWAERSQRFQDYARNKNGLNSRWNWRYLTNGAGPVAWTSHILSTTAKISYLYWLHYAYSLDREWLRTEGYPMIRGTAELYRNFPNLYQADDGRYHIRYVNNLESNWGGTDAPEEVLAMHTMFPLAIRAAEILGVDAELRPRWKEVWENLTPVPPAVQPAEYYEYCTVGSGTDALRQSVLAAYQRGNRGGVTESTTVRVLSRAAVIAANLGRAQDIKYLLPAQIRSVKEDNCDARGSGPSGLGVLRNRLMLREGPGAIECERLGVAANALYFALLRSVPPTPDQEPVNYIFPAWPREWDAEFTLAARSAFTIGASMQKGAIEFVEIRSQKGGSCRVQNPWNEASVSLYRNGRKAETLSGKLLVISTSAGETVALVPAGKPLVKKQIP